jgi:hypothetical protein
MTRNDILRMFPELADRNFRDPDDPGKDGKYHVRSWLHYFAALERAVERQQTSKIQRAVIQQQPDGAERVP